MLYFQPTNKVRLIEVNQAQFTPPLNERYATNLSCPNCSTTVIEKFKDKWVGKCVECGHIHSFFLPTPIQQVAHMLQNKIINNIGGNGSGKTTISSCKIREHINTVQQAEILAVAQDEHQIKNIARPELEKFFLEEEWVDKKDKLWVHRNGAKIHWITPNNPDKIRSANLTLAWMVEANGIKDGFKLYRVLMTRLRKSTGFVNTTDAVGNLKFEEDKMGSKRVKTSASLVHMLLEWNPEYCWIVEHLLKFSHTVIATQSVDLDIYREFCKPKAHHYTKEISDIVSIFSSTLDNPLLSKDFLTTMIESMSDDERITQFECDLTRKTGLVYTGYLKAYGHEKGQFAKVDHIDSDCTIIEGIDFGGARIENDPDAYIFGWFNERESKLVIADGFKISGMLISETAREIQKVRRKWNYSTHAKKLSMIGDPGAGGNRTSKVDRSSVFSQLRVHGINCIPAYGKGSHSRDVSNSISAGVRRVRELIATHSLVILPTAPLGIKEEFESYNLKPVVYDDSKPRTKNDILVIDKDNHYMDIIRLVVVNIFHLIKAESVQKMFNLNYSGGLDRQGLGENPYHPNVLKQPFYNNVGRHYDKMFKDSKEEPVNYWANNKRR